MSKTKPQYIYRVSRSVLNRSPLATGPGMAWKYVYDVAVMENDLPITVSATGSVTTNVSKGHGTLSEVRGWIKRHARTRGVDAIVTEDW